MARKIKNLIGQKFGKLTVLKNTGRKYKTNVIWKCQCDCGKLCEVRGNALTTNYTKSCGCLFPYIKHGHGNKINRSPTYTSWKNMKQRCYYSKTNGYKNYGGRGIKVCERWMKFENFLEDMGKRPKNKTLDRKNNNENYTLENCKWSTQKEQRNNRRNGKNIGSL